MDTRIECRVMVATEQDGVVKFHEACPVTDPAIAHLVQLLMVELRSPQPMSQLVISAIATVLLNHASVRWALPADHATRDSLEP